MDEELSAEHRIAYKPNDGGCAVTAVYNFPNGRRASVLHPHPRDAWQFWDFNTQRPPLGGLSLQEINQRLHDMAALKD